jgi:two-component system sensor histidine kinase DctS
VLVVLVRDNRRRLRAERDLGDALAFRKAMEDSLVTGMRARDLQGRITYVNPAFCNMVGFSAEELLGLNVAPYWPPELAQEYRQRQAPAAGAMPTPREGHESVFMRKDGSRFPVLIFEAPLITAQGQHTGWMSASSTSASSAAWRRCRAPRRSACRPRHAWPRWARWPPCSAMS